MRGVPTSDAVDGVEHRDDMGSGGGEVSQGKSPGLLTQGRFIPSGMEAFRDARPHVPLPRAAGHGSAASDALHSEVSKAFNPDKAGDSDADETDADTTLNMSSHLHDDAPDRGPKPDVVPAVLDEFDSRIPIGGRATLPVLPEESCSADVRPYLCISPATLAK